MKTKLTFLVLLLACFSCETGKTVSDAEKEKIKGEVKDVVNAIIKGCEEANFDLAIEPFQNTPDFNYIVNGSILSYQDVVKGMKPMFDLLTNQKVTTVEEKYSFLDKSTVLYTSNSKWEMNYKDGHLVLADPMAWFLLFRKIDNNWKVVYGVESYVEKNVVGKSANGLNQSELLKQFVGNWEIPSADGTIEYVSIKSLKGGNGLSVYAKWVAKGDILFDGTGFWGYDAAINKIDISILLSTGDVIHDHGMFISANTMEYVNINNAAAYKGISKSLLEFVSANEIKSTTIKDGKEEISTWKRVK